MVVFELIWLGVILLFAFIVAGVFVIADPDVPERRLANVGAEAGPPAGGTAP